MVTLTARRLFSRAILAGSVWLLTLCAASAQNAPPPPSPELRSPSPVLRISQPNEKVEMIVNTSRIIKLDKKIPQIKLQNQEILIATPLSPNQIQLFAKKAGVTQVNLWDENDQVYTIDVIVVGDARELSMLLESEFPNSSIRVRPISSGVLVSGYVERPQDVDRIKEISQEYFPKVIMNISLGGVQQVMLKMKVYEVSRTKLRSLGFDWAWVSNGGFVSSGVSQLLTAGTAGVSNGLTGNSTFSFKIVDGSSSFFGILEALRRDDLIKLMSEPVLVTYSGRPAYFHVGGEIPYLVSQGFGAIQVDWKDYGTKVDFVPIVLGNGKVRLEVRPQVSEFDDTRSGFQGIPAFKRSEVDTGVEMDAGQTLAIAGLVQRRTEAQKRGLPLVSDVPYLGAAFSMKKETVNEIETLVLVTPELVDAMDANEVPPCLPGTRTTSPSDWDLYMKGIIESPNRCPPCTGRRWNEPCPPKNGNPAAQPEQPTLPPGIEPQAEAVPLSQGQQPAMETGTQHYSKRSPAMTARRPASPNRQNPPSQPTAPASSEAAKNPGELPGFGGPIGYDANE